MRDKHLRTIGVKRPAVEHVVFRQIIGSFDEVVFAIELEAIGSRELLGRLSLRRIRRDGRRKRSAVVGYVSADNKVFFEEIGVKGRLYGSSMSLRIFNI